LVNVGIMQNEWSETLHNIRIMRGFHEVKIWESEVQRAFLLIAVKCPEWSEAK